MGKIFHFKPVMNKRNGQINIGIKKKDFPKEMREILNDISKFKFRMEGFTLKKKDNGFK